MSYPGSQTPEEIREEKEKLSDAIRKRSREVRLMSDDELAKHGDLAARLEKSRRTTFGKLKRLGEYSVAIAWFALCLWVFFEYIRAAM